MCLAVLLLFVGYGLGEVASIYILQSYIGGLPTLVTLFAAGALGMLLLSGRALLTMRAAGAAVARGEPVGEVLARSALVGAAAVLLIAPGLLSDAIAVILLLPPVRARMATKLVAHLRNRAQLVVTRHRGGGDAPRDGNVIDAEGVEKVEKVEPDAPAGRPSSDQADRQLR